MLIFSCTGEGAGRAGRVERGRSRAAAQGSAQASQRRVPRRRVRRTDPRYVLVVALLVGLASLPTLAAITAGSNELDDGTTGAMDVPFLPPPSAGPVIPVLPPPSPSPSPSSSAAGAQGQAGKRQTMPFRDGSSSSRRSGSGSHSPESGPSGAGSGSSRAGSASSGSASGSSGSASGSPGSDSPSGPQNGTPRGIRCRRRTAPPSPSIRRTCRLRHPAHRSVMSAAGVDPTRATTIVRAGHATGIARTPRTAPTGHTTARAVPGQSRSTSSDRSSRPSPHDPRTPRGGLAPPVIEAPDRSERWSDADRPDRGEADRQGAEPQRVTQMSHTIVSHRSSDRSEQSRRSPVTERPQNLRPASTGERTHNSRRHHHAEARRDDAQAPTRSYHGSHRAEHLHRADEAHARAYDRSSRVGRHHADDRQDRFNRW